MKGLIKGSNGSIQKQYGETYTEVQREGFSITRIFLRDLRGERNSSRQGAKVAKEIYCQDRKEEEGHLIHKGFFAFLATLREAKIDRK